MVSVKQGLLLIMFELGIVIASPSIAATVPDGKIIVRIEDGATSRCINSSTDRITMHMRRLIVNKDIGVFTEDKGAAIIVSTSISGEEGGLTPKKISYPRMYAVSVAPYSKGYTNLPVEEKLFSRFPLTNSGNSYDTAEIEFTILAKKGKAPFGVGLSALADISKNLPTPMNPFSEGFKYFSDYANKVVEGSLTTENNIGQQFKEGKITLSFSSTGSCVGDQEKTGTLAVISGVNEKESDGFVNVKKDYCWKADFRPVFTLKFAPKPNNSTCADVAEGTFKQINNPYTAFYLNAEPKVITASQNAQFKMLTLPSSNNIVLTKIKPSEIEKSILVSYDVPRTSSTTTRAVKKLSDKVSGVLGDSTFFTKVPKEDSAPNKANVITLPTTAVDGVAVDLAESLKRCAAHGVDTAKCY